MRLKRSDESRGGRFPARERYEDDSRAKAAAASRVDAGVSRVSSVVRSVYPRPVLPGRSAVDVVFAPADKLRLLSLRALGPVARRVVRDRELRVALIGAGAVVAALAGTLFLPWWLLALGPVVLGVPHIMADVRYLVVRPGFHKRVLFWLLVAAPVIATLFGAGLRAGAIAVAGAGLAARGAAWWKRAIVVGAAAALGVCAWVYPWWSDLSFAHLHNVAAIVLWWVWRERKGFWHFVPIALFFLALALIAAGALEPLLFRSELFWSAPRGLDANVQVPWLASEVPGEWAIRLTLSFVFAQSVHYAIWTRMIPEEDRSRDTPRTFAASFRALRADLGWPLVTAGVFATIALCVWATWDIPAARSMYLKTGLFHGHLELATFAMFFLEGARRARSARDT